VVVPGKGFFIDMDAPCPYIRISYSVATAADLDHVCITSIFPVNKTPYSNIATMLPFGFYQMATL